MFSLILFFALAVLALCALIGSVLLIGKDMGTCPQSGQSARAASKVIAVGYGACGVGGIVIAAAFLPLASAQPLEAFLFALGCVILALGIGFGIAMGRLRDVANRAALLAQGAQAQ